MEGFACDILGCPAVKTLCPFIPIDDFILKIAHKNRILRLVEQVRLLLDLCLGFLAFGDVRVDDKDRFWRAIGLVDQGPPALDDEPPAGFCGLVEFAMPFPALDERFYGGEGHTVLEKKLPLALRPVASRAVHP